jgi:hypothetical protein
MSRWHAFLTVSAAIAAAAIASAQSPPPTSSNGQSGARFLSASVYGSWFTHRESSGATILDLLVLWRGTPGWWAEGRGQDSSSGGGSLRTAQTEHVGGRALRIAFERPVHVAHIQDIDLPLDGANVVMVDDVDAATPRFTKVAVGPAMAAVTGISAVIRRSPELQTFLRCGDTVPDARMQSYVVLICEQMIGK